MKFASKKAYISKNKVAKRERKEEKGMRIFMFVSPLNLISIYNY